MAVTVILRDNNRKEFEDGITLHEIARKIGPSFANKTIYAKVNDEYTHLNHQLINGEFKLDFILTDTEEEKEVLFKEAFERISKGVQNVYSQSKMEAKHFEHNKFHLDFSSSANFSASNLEKIYELAQKEPTSYKKIAHFALLNVSEVSNNLQRLTGVCFLCPDELKTYLADLAIQQEKDHRKIGQKLQLFHMQDEAVGSVFWHPRGWYVFRRIEAYIRTLLAKNGYQEIKTPQLIDKALWEKSGHWEKFRENMFIAESEGRSLAVKPMSCPGHVQVFNNTSRSYKELPLRTSEFGVCHRNESSGSLHGLMRVRSLTQDDAHIFCEEKHITEETVNFYKLLQKTYTDFGFTDIKIKFSDRPDKRAGSDETWDKSEACLLEALKQLKVDYTVNKGEGAFYGPKLEFVLRDALGRDWQCGTLQLDFVLPERLKAKYVDEEGQAKQPVMIHRAILGSIERFIGILLENDAGELPVWLSYNPVAICTLSQDTNDLAQKIHDRLVAEGIQPILDNDSKTINYKIRHYSEQKIPYIAVIGRKEQENNTVSIRTFGKEDTVAMPLEDFISKLLEEVKGPNI